MAATPTTEPTTLQSDAELEQRIDLAHRRGGRISKLMNPVGIGALLVVTLALPMLLLPGPLGIVVALMAVSGASVGLGMAKGSAQYKAITQKLECVVELNARRDDPLRRAKALDETFGKAVTAGVKQDIKVSKPLKLRTGATP